MTREKNRMPLLPSKAASIAIFLAFCALILGATLILSPGWGFMDDHNNLRTALAFWEHPSWDLLRQIIMTDTALGRFRPIYMLWIVGIYKLAANMPTLIYIFTTALGLSLLPMWGITLNRAYHQDKRSSFLIWIYPLTFFIILPFWNFFMYISIQEKFIYFFGTPAVFFFLRAYAKESGRDMIFAFLWAMIATMGKETAIVLTMAFGAYALTDLLVFRRRPKLSLATGAGALAIFGSYYFFIKQLLKSYTARYAQNSSFTAMIEHFHHMPLFIKTLLLLALGLLAGHILRKLLRPKSEENGGALFAWLSVLYILILLPWGYPTYILAPLGIFIPCACVPFFLAGDRNILWRRIKRGGITILVFLAAIFLVIPNIQKMADKRMIVQKIHALHISDPKAVFYYPSPFNETADAVSFFSGTTIVYLRNSRLEDKDLSNDGRNYLLMNDECSTVTLINVSPQATVYRNSTWQMIQLAPGTETQTGFKPAFPSNPAQRLKTFVKLL